MTTTKEEFEDTKGLIRIRISKKNRQQNGQKKTYKRTNNDLQNIHIKLKIEFNINWMQYRTKGFYSWFIYAKNIVSEIGFDIESTEKCQTIKEVKQYKHIIKNSSNDYNKNLILNKNIKLKWKQ
jgi:hypothetical protein